MTFENSIRVAPFERYHDFINRCRKTQQFGLTEEEFTALKSMGPDGQKSRGLGDTVAKVTQFFGVQTCGGCNQRKDTLNQMFPYKVA